MEIDAALPVNALSPEDNDVPEVLRSPHLWAGFLQGTTQAVALIDAGGRIEWANPAFHQLTGRADGELLGLALDAVATDEQPRPAGPGKETLVSATVLAGRAQHRELVGQRPDGNTFWLDAEAHPRFNPQGETEGVLLVARDIGARRTAIAALQRHHLAVTEHTIVSETDGAGRITYANPLLEQISGYSQEELLGQDHRLLNSGYHPRSFWKQMFATLAREGVWHGEVCNRAKDGTLYWVKATNIAFRDEAGRIAHYLSIRNDITALKEAEERLETMFRALADGMLLVDAEAGIRELNPAATELLGLPREALLGVPIESLPLRFAAAPQAGEPPEMQPASIRLALCESRRNLPATVEVPPGGERQLMINTEPVISEAGRIDGAVVTLRDVSESRRHEERFALIVASAGLATWDFDVGSGRVEFNGTWTQLLGYGPEELDSSLEALADLVHPEDRNRFTIAMMDNIKARSTEFREEVRLQRRDGSYLWLLLSGRVIQRAVDGRASRAMGIAMDISRSKALEGELVAALAELRRRAEHDQLTNLPNRDLLTRRIARAAARKRRVPGYEFAVLFFDFDRFKSINDTLGHQAGDMLLKQIAQRLSDNLRSTDTVARSDEQHLAARIGGDEFVVLLDGIASPADAQRTADRLLEALAEPYQLGEHEISSTASIGIVTSDMDFDSVDELMSSADTAMYEAKASGRGRHVIFDPALRERLQQRVEMEMELRRAIAEDGFELRFQPVLNLASGRLEGVDVRLAWRHPRLGELPIERFMPIARETGLAPQVRECMLRALARQSAAWPADPTGHARMGVGIQVSRPRALDPGFIDRLDRELLVAGRTPGDILIQISEAEAMVDPGATAAAFSGLRERGFKTCLTSFGAGNSSIARLRSLPLDYIRLDPSLVRSSSDERGVMALLRVIIEFAHDLEIKVIAAGIDTQAQLVGLQSLECDLGQGCHISAPLTAEQLGAYRRGEKEG